MVFNRFSFRIMTVFSLLLGLGTCSAFRHMNDSQPVFLKQIVKSLLDNREFLYTKDVIPGQGLEITAVHDPTTTKAGTVCRFIAFFNRIFFYRGGWYTHVFNRLVFALK
jgi:hypothetical protein